MKTLNDEMERAQRSGSPCSIALIDLDFFKRINDGFGHPAGDEVLRRFARALAERVRAVDKIGRYSGEGFLLILPDSAKDQAVLAVDRLRQIIADLDWSSISTDVQVAMSAGVAQASLLNAPSEILARADAAPYRAKDAGRNRVVSA